MAAIRHTVEHDNPFLNRAAPGPEVSLSKLETQVAQLDRRVEEILQTTKIEEQSSEPPRPMTVTVWGVPFSRVTLGETLLHIDRLIAKRQPGYFITANLNYVMLTSQQPELRRINERAAFIVCDGMPMVWWSRRTRTPLPERVAGSELIYALTKWAAVRRYRIYFLGGAPGVAASAAEKLLQRYAGLEIAGVESPPFRQLTPDEESDMVNRIRDSNADILYVAFGQPKGELWIAKHVESIGVPICVQIGASFDFVAGGVARAPVWMQRYGFEWFYRLCQEPKRLTNRYWHNACFLLKALLADCCR